MTSLAEGIVRKSGVAGYRAWVASLPDDVIAGVEDELCGLVSGGGYEGPGRSPDRADACVWGLSELMLGKVLAGPRVSTL